MEALTKKLRLKPELNMLIVAAFKPEMRLEMKLVHRSFCNEHLQSVEIFHPCSYNVAMGEAKASVRKTASVNFDNKKIDKIEGLDETCLFIDEISLC